MKENFALAVGFVLKHEGGYTNDPNDPGGETNFGISKRYHPEEDIKNMTIDRAAQIYKTQYWDVNNLESIPFPLDVIALDTVVNCRKEVMNEEVAGNKTADEALFVRTQYYVARVIENPVKIKYFFGWMNRIAELRQLIHDEQKRRN